MSAVSSIFHVVINTYRRQMTIPDETSEHMDYRLTWFELVKKFVFDALTGFLTGTKRRGPSTHLHGVFHWNRVNDPLGLFESLLRKFDTWFSWCAKKTQLSPNWICLIQNFKVSLWSISHKTINFSHFVTYTSQNNQGIQHLHLREFLCWKP